MSTTDVATRNGHSPAQPSTALAIKTGQTTWDDKQRSALVAMGVSEKATPAELAVFFHQCRNTQLDPFLKQIYLIHRRTKEGDRWVDKPTTQVGIDGFRVIRDRIADRKGLRVEYEDTTWYDAEGNPFDVWLWDEPATACKFVVLVDGRRFPSVLRFNEYCQRNRDGERVGRWRDGHAHQIEKCAEADALRKAFPNDMSGLVLEDAAPLSDPDAPGRLPQDRRQVSTEQIRDRRPAAPARPGHPDYVDAEIVDDTDVPPADTAAEAGGTPAGGGQRQPALATGGQRDQLETQRQRLHYGDSPEDWDGWLADLGRIAGLNTPIADPKELTQPEAADAIKRLKSCKDAGALRRLLATGERDAAEGGERDE